MGVEGRKQNQTAQIRFISFAIISLFYMLAIIGLSLYGLLSGHAKAILMLYSGGSQLFSWTFYAVLLGCFFCVRFTFTLRAACDAKKDSDDFSFYAKSISIFLYNLLVLAAAFVITNISWGDF